MFLKTVSRAVAFLLLLTACSTDSRTPLVVYSPHAAICSRCSSTLRSAASGRRRALARHGLAGRLRSRALRAGESSGRRVVRRSVADSRAGRRRLLARLLPASWPARLRRGAAAPVTATSPPTKRPPSFSMRRKWSSPRRPAGLGRPPESKMERQADHSRSARERHDGGRCSD